MARDYYGTKKLKATPMTRGEYNTYRNWILPGDENPDDEGYLVEYADSPGNDSRHQGYISWSPKDVFEAAYQPLNALSFGHAIEALKAGKRVARAGWNGKGMFLFYIGTWTYTDGKQDNYPNLPFIAMKTADDKVVPWLASQTDVLANDWQVLED